jgi:putative ABC transport system permease protein
MKLRLTPSPVLRAWVRGAVRRPGRAAVVIVTLTVMTVGVVSALVASDSLEQLFVADAEALWGDVDVEVTSSQGASFDESMARAVGADAGAHSTAWAPRMLLRGVAEASGRRDADTVVMGLGPEEQTYPALAAVSGTADVLRLAPDELLLNERLARRLAASVGDVVTLVVGVPEVHLERPGSSVALRRPPQAVEFTGTVAGVVADSGVADLGRTPNVLLRRDILQRHVDLEGQVTHLHMTAAEDADALIRAIDPLLRAVRLARAPVAEDALEIADDEGGQFRSILLTLAALVVAAAMVATIQMLIALAEDRSREIGVLRALGTPRRSIVRVVTVEALVYAVVAVILGTLVALPVANGIAGLLADHFAALSAGRGREQVALLPLVDPATLVVGAVIVAGAAAMAGRSAGRRLADVAPDTLLRGPIVQLPERPLSPRRPVVVAMTGSLLLGTGLGGGAASDALRYMGLTLLLTAWWLHRRRSAEVRERIDRRAALAALAWATLGAGALADFSQGYETGFGILVVAGIVTVAAITVLLAGRFRSVLRLLRTYAPMGRWQVSLRTAGAYADAATGRTGRLVATFGIVLFIAAALEVLGGATRIDVDRQAGGFDVMAQSAAGMENLDVSAIDGWGGGVHVPTAMVPEDRFGVEQTDGEDSDIVRLRYPVRLVAVTSDFAAGAQGFRLAEALPEYPDAQAALDAVLRDGNKAVVDRYARPPGAQLGEDVVLDLGLGLRRYELIGVLDTFLLGSVMVSVDEYIDLVASAGSTLLLGRAADGTTPEQLAGAVDGWGRGVGTTTRTMADVASDVVAVNRTFTDTFALMLLLGLAVALVAVAAMLVRSARERRPYLSVLRAMGLRRSTVAVALAAEPVTVALVGGVAGLAGGLLVLRGLFAAGFSDLAFTIDVVRVVAIIGGLAVLLVVLCWLVAWPAVPREPGESLRDIA